MFDSVTILGVVCLYMGLLSAVAAWAEGKSQKGRSLANNPLVYSFALGVYCTTWTYYGSVGTAATSGLLFLTLYFGPTMVIVLWGSIQRKLIRIRNEYRITSIADFISSRYNRSQTLAALVTFIAFVGVTPYLALQFKAVGSTFAILTAPDREVFPWIASYRDLLVTGLLIVFTIVVGMRRLDAAERHPGMMMALAVECCLKLVAFLAAGAFVTYGMFAGFGDLLDKAGSLAHALPKAELTEPFSALKWNAYLVVSMAAVMCLPRQFHVAVVENLDESHVKTAMWVFPLYLLLISVFTFPIAVAGLLKGFPMDAADTFVLALPLKEGRTLLSLFVFLGGFSAAAGMIMVSSIAISTMMTNHLLLPIFGWFRPLGILRRHLLGCRWCVVTIFICIGFWSQKYVGEPYMLGNMGMISFAAVAQFAPALVGGLFWRRAHEAGAIVGVAGGFMIWSYTLLLPAFVESGWLSSTLLNEGPWGIGGLNPRSLFGIVLGDPVLHSLFWSMLVNIGAFVAVSLSFEQSEEQQRRVEEFMGASGTRPFLSTPARGRRSIHLGEKKALIADLLSEFFGPWKAIEITEECVTQAGLAGKKWISVLELSELLGHVERTLTGSVGAAEAHRFLEDQEVISPEERHAISEAYGEILAELKVPPEELKQRIDYHRERETLLAHQAAE
ncbi:MAG: sodium:solute symporter family protein, partial [Desulfomonile sp.]|nr:sodium:solute symporter family protein [Desulfomonile sp.]